MRNRFDLKEYAGIARKAAAEGCVLLQNEQQALPLRSGERVAVFGRNQLNYYKSGTGSGGMVNTAYVISILDALKEDTSLLLDRELLAVYEAWVQEHPFDMGAGWAQEPWFQEEMELSPELVERAAAANDAALILIGRTAGEDKDNGPDEGSWFLTGKELSMLRLVCAAFPRTIVVLNVGSIIDMSWMDEVHPSAVLYAWQGGQEGGHGVVDVLTGRVTPCGKLTDTIAYQLEDYPSHANYGGESRNVYAEDIYVGYRYFETFARDRVRYPFGYGLSYTTFAVSARLQAVEKEIVALVQVTNTGTCSGKEVIQIYLEKPQGKLGQPARQLISYAKTGTIQPEASGKLVLKMPIQVLASFDDSGVTGHPNAWVIEEGEYTFYLGTDVRSAAPAGSLRIAETFAVKQCEEALAPEEAFMRLRPVPKEGAAGTAGSPYAPGEEKAPKRTVNPWTRRAHSLPEEYAYTGDRGIRLADVAEGKETLEHFAAQLNDEDLCAIARGEGMCSPKVTPGTAGAFGGVTDRLLAFGIPVCCCADGPSGIRMDSGTVAFSMPSGTALASTFNNALVEELYAWEGMELRRDRIETLLGPGMNLHRHPLNGRNFEYFSEDPLLTGEMAAAQLQGMHRFGVTGTIKHFACNNQEKRRDEIEALVSARALRELYLKGYEIAVTKGHARSIMTSYNPLNGERNASNYDLLTTILRKDWGYDGIVMTDWWAKVGPMDQSSRQDTGAMIAAQNDLYMVTPDAKANTSGDHSMEALAAKTLTRGELQRTAMNICRFAMQTPAMLRLRGIRTVLDDELERSLDEAELAGIPGNTIRISEDGSVDPARIDTKRGKTSVLEVPIEGLTAQSYRDASEEHYHLRMRVRAGERTPELAQLPITVHKDRELAGTISLTGKDREWKDIDLILPDSVVASSFQVRLFFGESGVELQRLSVQRG